MSTTVQGRPAPKRTGHGRAALAATTLAMGLMAGCGLDETASIKLTVSASGLTAAAPANVKFTLVEDSSVSFTVALPGAADGGNVSVMVANWIGEKPSEFGTVEAATPQLTEGIFEVVVIPPPGAVATAPSTVSVLRGEENVLALTFAPPPKPGGFTQADLDAAAAKAKADADAACAALVSGTHPEATTCAAAIAALAADVAAEKDRADAAAADVTRLQGELAAALARCEQALTEDCDSVIAGLQAQLAAAQAAKTAAEAARDAAQAEAARLQGELTAAQAAQATAEAAKAEAERQRDAAQTAKTAAEQARDAAVAAKAAAEAEAARLQRELEERTQAWICIQAGPSTAPTAPATNVTVTIPGFTAGNPRPWMDTEPCFSGAVFGPLSVGVRPTVVVSRTGEAQVNSVLAPTLSAGTNPLNIQSFIP